MPSGLGKVQLEIMRILWRRGRATAREITEEMSQTQQIAHSTVQTLLRQLQATLLLGLGLLAGRHLRRHGPAVSSFVYQTTVVALLIGAVLAMPVGGHLGSPWGVTLPSAHDGLGEEGVPALRSAREGMRG